jgi:hypothetical protein
MGKSNTFAAGWLALVFQGTTIAGIAQNVVSGALTELWVALHTANPGAAGNQATSEAAYTGYARVGIVRTSSGWSLSGEEINPVSNISFPTCTGGTETETYASIGTDQTGTGEILYSGPITPPISVSPGIPPTLLTGTSVTES